MLRNDVITWDTASRQGGRKFNADAVGAHDMVFALADGIGDTMWAAEAARVATDVAARTPAVAGPVEAILAAQRALEAMHTGADCVLVVAMGDQIAWVGDVRAYGWDGTQLVQLTSDQTLAEYFRAHNSIPTPRMEHVVTNSLRHTRRDQIGLVTARNCTAILLSSDGVHKTVSSQIIEGILAETDTTAHTRVSTLVDTAMLMGATDNSTALMIMNR
jgi:serine/threonine protein phosphatase PrpC